MALINKLETTMLIELKSTLVELQQQQLKEVRGTSNTQTPTSTQNTQQTKTIAKTEGEKKK
uniref:Uncharacterized protein n=1 Tax=Meloidogyne enterolobii TaxID=390850 RepID=A0A6V7VWZ5_MELEN|nr:unnamed protein product [Meloidogyne enterolobii]